MPPDLTRSVPRDDAGWRDALRALPMPAPPAGGLAHVRATIAARRRARWTRGVLGGLAIAATVVAAVLLVPRAALDATSPTPVAQTPAAEPDADVARIDALIAQNQQWETALRRADARPDALDGRAALASAELEDLIGMIDLALADGDARDQQALWQQRVQLMSELASLRNGSRAISAASTGGAELLPTGYVLD